MLNCKNLFIYLEEFTAIFTGKQQENMLIQKDTYRLRSSQRIQKELKDERNFVQTSYLFS